MAHPTAISIDPVTKEKTYWRDIHGLGASGIGTTSMSNEHMALLHTHGMINVTQRDGRGIPQDYEINFSLRDLDDKVEALHFKKQPKIANKLQVVRDELHTLLFEGKNIPAAAEDIRIVSVQKFMGNDDMAKAAMDAFRKAAIDVKSPHPSSTHARSPIKQPTGKRAILNSENVKSHPTPEGMGKGGWAAVIISAIAVLGAIYYMVKRRPKAEAPEQKPEAPVPTSAAPTPAHAAVPSFPSKAGEWVATVDTPAPSNTLAR